MPFAVFVQTQFYSCYYRFRQEIYIIYYRT